MMFGIVYVIDVAMTFGILYMMFIYHDSYMGVILNAHELHLKQVFEDNTFIIITISRMGKTS